MKLIPTTIALGALLSATALLGESQVQVQPAARGNCPVAAPVVTVTTVSHLNSGGACPVENECFKVDWTSTGVNPTGFKADFKVVVAGQMKTATPKTLPGSARTATFNIFMNGAPTSYDAKVTADFASCVTASKAANF